MIFPIFFGLVGSKSLMVTKVEFFSLRVGVRVRVRVRLRIAFIG